MAERKRPRVIKRYANRKLYDMTASCYITHDEIADLVKAGEEVKIIDNRTKEDLTTRTLTQILFDKEKKEPRTLPLSTLRNIFQSGGYFIQKHIAQPVSNLRDEAEETVRKVFRARGHEEAEQAPSEPVELPVEEDAGGKASPVDGVRDWLENSQNSLETMQKTLEERWNLVVHSLGHFDANRRRIAELEQRVVELERQVADLRGGKS